MLTMSSDSDSSTFILGSGFMATASCESFKSDFFDIFGDFDCSSYSTSTRNSWSL